MTSLGNAKAVMPCTLILISVIVASCTARSGHEADLVSYTSLPINTEQPDSDYFGLVEVHGGPELELLSTKTVNLGSRVGSVLFVDYQRGDTTPPSRMICAYRPVTAKRYKLLVLEIQLFYGSYRDNPLVKSEAFLSDLDGDGTEEILVFSETADELGYLKGVYLYDVEKDYYVYSSMQRHRIKRLDVDAEKITSLLDTQGNSYSRGYVELFVDLK